VSARTLVRECRVASMTDLDATPDQLDQPVDYWGESFDVTELVEVKSGPGRTGAAVPGTHAQWFRVVHQGVRIAHMTKPSGER
jgi:hypothetical protein